MHRMLVTVALAATLGAGTAMAGDLLYHPAPSGSPFYGGGSMITAQVDIGGGLAFASGAAASGTGGVYSGTGRASMNLRDNWNLQVEVLGMLMAQNDLLDSSAVNLDHMNVGGTVYLYKRDGTRAYGPGITIERRASDIEFFKGVVFGFDPRHGPWEYHGYAQIGWLTTGTANGLGLGGQLGAQYWMDRNTALGADIAAYNFNMPGGTSTVLTGALTALRRHDTLPIAGYGQLRVDSYSGVSTGTLVTATAGARFYINPYATDAQSDAETGPAFTTRLRLPARL